MNGSALFAMMLFTSALVGAGVHFLRADAKARRREALRKRVQWSSAAQCEVRADPESLLRETQSDLGALFSRAATRIPLLRKLELLLYRAGNPFTPTRLMTASGLLALSGLGIGALIFGTLLEGLPFAAIGALPWLYVVQLKKRRTQRFDRQFPEALSLLTRALRAGHSLSMGMQMVASELPDPVGTEFGLVAREIALGLAPNTAIANLQDRFGATDLPFFVTSVLVQQETGGNLAEILDNLGKVIRDRMQFHGKVKSLTAEARFSANVLLALPAVVVVLMYMVSPENVRPLFETEQGHMLALASAVMLAIGAVICRKISKVEF
jgi:tight adherence protein B